MTPDQIKLIEGLNRCSLPIATSKKRFIRDMAFAAQSAPDKELTPKQYAYLLQLRHYFRKQFNAPCPCCRLVSLDQLGPKEVT